MTDEREVWTYVGHKDGKFAGAISGRLEHNPALRNAKREAKWQKEIAEFCGDFIVKGFEITKVYSAEEYRAFIHGMPMWTPADQNRKKAKADRAQLSLMEDDR